MKKQKYCHIRFGGGLAFKPRSRVFNNNHGFSLTKKYDWPETWLTRIHDWPHWRRVHTDVVIPKYDDMQNHAGSSAAHWQKHLYTCSLSHSHLHSHVSARFQSHACTYSLSLSLTHLCTLSSLTPALAHLLPPAALLIYSSGHHSIDPALTHTVCTLARSTCVTIRRRGEPSPRQTVIYQEPKVATTIDQKILRDILFWPAWTHVQ